ncbi:MAG: hypothetical protein A2V66_15525 [Ignavibacteria bacterium RBG_13_36_8]|nr:MAG: hypothetical protein A2V66_15525 [Ignavibacteria bacterium RBG_13_36_8]
MSQKISFDFGQYKKKKQEIIEEKVELITPEVKKTIPKLPFLTPRERKLVLEEELEEPESVEITLQDSNIEVAELDETDLAIFKLLSKKFLRQGTNIVRFNQKNPFLLEFFRLGNLLGKKQTFRNLHALNCVKKTKFADQWQLK